MSSKHKEKPTPIKKISQIECYLCRRQFKGFQGVQGHMITKHTKTPKKRCKICDDFYIDKTHSCAGLKLNCEYCSKSFESLHRLNAHLDAIHADKSFYTCEICSEEFKTLAFLNHHRSKHKPGCFQCPKCPEKFDTRYEKRKHMHVHTRKRSKFFCKNSDGELDFE